MRPIRSTPSPGLFAAVLAALLLGPVSATAQLDPTSDDGSLVDSRDAWIAAAYLGGAALSFPLDERVAVAIRDSALQEVPGLKPAARAFNLLGFPGSLIISGGLYGVGRIGGHDDLADIGLHTGEAIVVAELVTYAIKMLAGRARPGLGIHDPFDFQLGRGLEPDDHHESFPSGHTTAAFATAAALAHEIERVWGGNDWLIGLATYGPATLVGLSRMFDNRHWTSDVVFGAAIGAFGGWKVVRYNHANPGNDVDDFFLSISVTPGDWSRTRVGLIPVAR